MNSIRVFLKDKTPAQLKTIFSNINAEGYAALHLPILLGNLDSVKILVEEFGANINQETSTGLNALELAFQNSKEEIAKWLLGRMSEKEVSSNLIKAVKSKNLNLVKFLYAHGANIKTKNSEGKNLLTIALEVAGPTSKIYLYLKTTLFCLNPPESINPSASSAAMDYSSAVAEAELDAGAVSFAASSVGAPIAASAATVSSPGSSPSAYAGAGAGAGAGLSTSFAIFAPAASSDAMVIGITSFTKNAGAAVKIGRGGRVLSAASAPAVDTSPSSVSAPASSPQGLALLSIGKSSSTSIFSAPTGISAHTDDRGSKTAQAVSDDTSGPKAVKRRRLDR